MRRGSRRTLTRRDRGFPLYEACGFVKGGTLQFSAEKKDPSERWKELQGELLSFSWWPMWRPVGGHVEPGITVIPWHGATLSVKIVFCVYNCLSDPCMHVVLASAAP